jgi:hypothetical protein
MYCKYLKSVNARGGWAGIANFLGGGLEWKGAQILEYTPIPPNRKPVGTALVNALINIAFSIGNSRF